MGTSNFNINKGVNLSHWLSQVFGWSPKDKFIIEKDIDIIKNLGYDHVRLPIDEECIWDEKGKFINENIEFVHKCINWCINKKMPIVIDLHILRSHHFNAVNNEGKMTLWNDHEEQTKFFSLWVQLSSLFAHYPNEFLAYELMNEPVAPEHDDWNLLINHAITVIRTLEPERTIVMGSNMWQFPYTFPFLKVPEKDKNIILATHFYDPILVTHYKAYWMSIKNYSGKISYPGISISEEDRKKSSNLNDKNEQDYIDLHNGYFDKNVLAEKLKPAIDKAKETGLRLYCSEFGCLPNCGKEIQFRYYKDLINVFKENNISYCHWDYKGDFGIMGWDREKHINTGILKEKSDIIVNG